jgi:hypothetical protein
MPVAFIRNAKGKQKGQEGAKRAKRLNIFAFFAPSCLFCFQLAFRQETRV